MISKDSFNRIYNVNILIVCGIDEMVFCASTFKLCNNYILDIKVLLQINPNHSGKTHPYFMRSQEGDKGFKDYYIWHNGLIANDGTKIPPNNWVCLNFDSKILPNK